MRYLVGSLAYVPLLRNEDCSSILEIFDTR